MGSIQDVHPLLRRLLPSAGLRPLWWRAALPLCCLCATVAGQEGFDIQDLEREAEQEALETDKDPAAEALSDRAEKLAKAGQLAQAIAAYRVFLKRHLNHSQSAAVTKRIADLQTQLALKGKEETLQQVISDSEEGSTQQVEAWIALADFYIEHGCLAELQAFCGTVLSVDPSSREALGAPLRIAARLEEANEIAAAITLYEQTFCAYRRRAAALFLGTLKAVAEQTGPYRQPRHQRLRELDPPRSLLDKIGALHREHVGEDDAEQARRRLAAALPRAETCFAYFLAEAEHELAAGSYGLACDLFLASLKPPRTAPPPGSPQVSPRSGHLQEYRAAQPWEELVRAFRGLWECGDALARRRLDGERLVSLFSARYPVAARKLAASASDESSTNLDRRPVAGRPDSLAPLVLARMWQMAYEDALDGRWDEVEDTYRAIKTSLSQSFFEPVSLHWLGLAASQQGLYWHAIRRFDVACMLADSLGVRLCGLRLRGLYEKGSAQLRWGRYARAASTFESFLSSPALTTTLLPSTLYRLGQCQEYQGAFRSAAKSYRTLLEIECASMRLEALAERAIARMEHHWAATGPGSEGSGKGATDETLTDQDLRGYARSKVVYVGENRGAGGDRGDWRHSYGREAFILCGMMAPHDVVGTRGQKPKSSGNVNELPMSCRWHGDEHGDPGRRALRGPDGPDDPGALWNPISSAHVRSNWTGRDARKSGPGDLVVDLSIPSGVWRLSLAFADDVSLCGRSGSAWTVYLKDTNGRFLAGTEVANHLCAVYKHFAVRGPLDLQVHVCRDTSAVAALSGIFLDPKYSSFSGIFSPASESRDPDLSVARQRCFEGLRERVAQVTRRASEPDCDFLCLSNDLEQLVSGLDEFADAAAELGPPAKVSREVPVQVITARQWAFEGHYALAHPHRIQAEAAEKWLHAVRTRAPERKPGGPITELAEKLHRGGRGRVAF